MTEEKSLTQADKLNHKNNQELENMSGMRISSKTLAVTGSEGTFIGLHVEFERNKWGWKIYKLDNRQLKEVYGPLECEDQVSTESTISAVRRLSGEK